MEKKSYVVIPAVLLLLAGCAAGNYGEEIVVEKSAPPMENPDQAAVDRKPEDGVPAWIDAPARYRCSVDTENLVLAADAVVTVPDVDGIRIYRTVWEDFTEEDVNKLKELAAEQIGGEWTEETRLEQPEYTGYSAVMKQGDAAYELNYKKMKEEQKAYVPQDYSGIYLRSSGQTGMQTEIKMPEDWGTAGIWEGIKENASALVEKLGYSDMELTNARWYQVDNRSHGRQEEEVTLWFTRNVGGIPVHAQRQYFAPPGDGIWLMVMQEGIVVSYGKDGTLRGISLTGKERITGQSEEQVFLIPFSEVGQIFEQVIQSEGYHAYAAQIQSGDIVKTKQVQISLEQVELGYRYVHERDGTGYFREGKLVPVWNFLGKMSIVLLQEDGKELARQDYGGRQISLMQIDATDGTVLSTLYDR